MAWMLTPPFSRKGCRGVQPFLRGQTVGFYTKPNFVIFLYGAHKYIKLKKISIIRFWLSYLLLFTFTDISQCLEIYFQVYEGLKWIISQMCLGVIIIASIVEMHLIAIVTLKRLFDMIIAKVSTNSGLVDTCVTTAYSTFP